MQSGVLCHVKYQTEADKLVTLLCLGGMDLILFLAACMVWYCIFMAKAVLVSQQCFGYCLHTGRGFPCSK